MPQSHRLLDAHHTKPAVLVIVKIRAADAAKSDAHPQLGATQGLGDVSGVGVEMLQTKIECAMAHESANAALRGCE